MSGDANRRAQFGGIRDHLPNRHAGNRRVGLPSDDTQLAFRTLESLLAHRGLDPEALARDLSSRRIFGMGGTVRAFLRRYRDEGLPWHEAAIESAGDGALMRIAPVLVPHLRRPSAALWADTALAAMITHNDRASTGSCIAFVHLLRELIGRTTAPEPSWWIDTFIAVLAPLEGDTHYRTRTPHIAYEGPLWRFVDLHVRHALARDMDTAAACDWWYSGAYLLETVPSVLYVLCRHGHDPEEAIVRAVNDTRDNDTAGAIVGAAVGALHGRSRLPRRWVDGLLGRTAEADDGRIFELIEAAWEVWGGGIDQEEP